MLKLNLITLLGFLATIAVAAPQGTLLPLADLFNNKKVEMDKCSDDEKKYIQTALSGLVRLAAQAHEAVNAPGWEGNLGYNAYFTAADRTNVLKAYETLMRTAMIPNKDVKFKFLCVEDKDQVKAIFDGTSASYLQADPTPEDYNLAGSHTPGIRTISLYPKFFSLKNLPGDSAEVKKDWCGVASPGSHHYYETNAGLLLREISRLDSWGIYAGYPQREQLDQKPTGYKFHGAVYWQNSTSATRARNLKSEPVDIFKPAIERWLNAPSLAGAATDMWAIRTCNLKELPHIRSKSTT